MSLQKKLNLGAETNKTKCVKARKYVFIFHKEANVLKRIAKHK